MDDIVGGDSGTDDNNEDFDNYCNCMIDVMVRLVTMNIMVMLYDWQNMIKGAS